MNSNSIRVQEQLKNQYRVTVHARNFQTRKHYVTLERYFAPERDDTCSDGGIVDSVSGDVLIHKVDRYELQQFVREFLLRLPGTESNDYWIYTTIQDLAQKADEKAKAASKAKPFNPVNFSEMAEWEDTESEYAIKEFIPFDESTVVAGPAKGFKTTSTLHMVICMAAGVCYLGIFEVLRELSVGFFSAESGLRVLARNTRRIALSIGVSVGDIDDRLQFHGRVPLLTNESDLIAVERLFDDDPPDITIFDPLNRMLPPEALSNTYVTNRLLARITDICREHDVTPVFVHHAKRSATRPGHPMVLDDLTDAGNPEYFRS